MLQNESDTAEKLIELGHEMGKYAGMNKFENKQWIQIKEFIL